MRTSDAKLKIAVYLIIVVHLILVVLHAAAHQVLEVNPTTLQLSFIFIVIMAAPVIAGLLMWKYERAGAVLFTLSMAGSFLFGAYNHFVGHSIDHVAEVVHLQPEIWSTIFRLSAIALTISEAAGTVAGGWLLMIRQPRLESNAA
jgi:hypothetical protein